MGQVNILGITNVVKLFLISFGLTQKKQKVKAEPIKLENYETLRIFIQTRKRCYQQPILGLLTAELRHGFSFTRLFTSKAVLFLLHFIA
jgi:hypothetical protein